MSGMEPLFGEEHDAYRETVRMFVQREIDPFAEDWENERDYPRELFQKAGAAGLFGAKFDERWGGTGPDYAAEAVAIEELSRSLSFGTASDLGAHSQLAALYIDRFGSDDQKERYLRPSIAGDLLGALAVTEPGAGSDVNGIHTRATRDGDDWVLNGSKVFITNGAWSDYVVVAGRTSDDPGHGNITLFVVDAGSAGFEQRRMKMIAWHTSHTGELFFDEVAVSDANRLGDVGSGFASIMTNFQWERVMMSLSALALANLSLETAIEYARERTAFGRPVIRFQVWQHRFADLAVRLRTSKALTYKALRLHIAAEQGQEVPREELVRVTSMAKLHSQRLAWEVADECVQVHGGAGALKEYPAQRFWRDARVGPIGGGTDDIMRNLIARSLGLGVA
ncbi:MAG TPA: acyl-CoA dehydrogenase family protein [Acidimicrobiia bacterium]|nr:acyl-CoA dehydrogenase family protein [Acidimicrobiia bacterium]